MESSQGPFHLLVCFCIFSNATADFDIKDIVTNRSSIKKTFLADYTVTQSWCQNYNEAETLAACKNIYITELKVSLIKGKCELDVYQYVIACRITACIQPRQGDQVILEEEVANGGGVTFHPAPQILYCNCRPESRTASDELEEVNWRRIFAFRAVEGYFNVEPKNGANKEIDIPLPENGEAIQYRLVNFYTIDTRKLQGRSIAIGATPDAYLSKINLSKDPL